MIFDFTETVKMNSKNVLNDSVVDHLKEVLKCPCIHVLFS